MKAWTELTAGEFNAASQRLWKAIDDSADAVATRINTDPIFVKKIARFMVTGGHEPSSSEKRAREIMGTNIFGAEEAVRIYGYPGQGDLRKLSKIRTPQGRLITEEEMHECKDTHVLVADFGLSILDICNITSGIKTYGKPKPLIDVRIRSKGQLNLEGKVGWQLVRKAPVKNSTTKTWNNQHILHSKDEETPTARIVIYTTIGLFLTSSRERLLFERIGVRCTDSTLPGLHILVGPFRYTQGLIVDNVTDDLCDESIGLSAAKKQ